MPPRSASDRGAGPRGGGPTRGRGAARGGVRVAITAPGRDVQTVGVRRPGYGTGGKVVNTIVNAFKITIPDSIIHHYDVVVNADSKKLPPRVNMHLFDRLQRVVAPEVFTPPAVYDCRSNAFTTHKLKLGPRDSAAFDVTMEREGPPSKDARPPKVYRITLTKVAEINTEILHRFITGNISQDNSVTTSLTALNIAIRMEPNLRFPFNSRSFFTDEGSRSIGGGMELWRGYFQSIRPSQGQMYLNVDIATGIMFKKGELIGLCLEFLNSRDPRKLSPQRRANDGGLTDRERISLQRFITNLRVSTSHGGRTQTRAIKKLTPEGANEIMFTKREGGPSISVANYFRQELNKPLKYPNLICIEVGSGAKIPLELCTVPAGQIMRKQIPTDKTNEVVEFSKLSPQQRLTSIRHGLGVLAHGQSEYVREFGMAVNPDPIVVKARVIAPPMLRYGPGSREPTIRPGNGQWNMRDKKLFRPQTVKSWIIVIYENQGRFNQNAADTMAKAFCGGAESVGMRVEDRDPLIFWENGHGDIIAQLRKNGKISMDKKKQPPSLIVVVLPEGGNHIYTAVKHFGDVLMGVVTQCLKSQKVARANLQYWANVMLKVNAKLGGVNNVLENSFLNDPVNPTIVMGADVMHPAPGAVGRPSFASLVSSVDLMTAKYIPCSRVQKGRQEIIEDLESMVNEVLTLYIGYGAVEKRKNAPTRLIFYRDGVSEPQFQHVLAQELPMIKNACMAVGIKPKITLIIVGKRHHIRMFPQNPGDADRSGNCQAGTTIDDGLGHPTEFDYYQLTHGGLLGTSRPAHYSVIYDENNFSADSMQNISFSLCHVYARATRSVSIPAPVYYADIVCSRAKHHYTPGGDVDLSETATQVSSSETQLEAYKTGYKVLHPNHTKLMYFM